MKKHRFVFTQCLIICLAVLAGAAPVTWAKEIPPALKPWESWATWDDVSRDCPRPYSDAKKPLCVWPSRLELQVGANGAQFQFGVTVFGESWMGLPGDQGAWPVSVKANGSPVPVLEHEGHPALLLQPGTYRIEGSYQWAAVPQRLALPAEIGILLLDIEGKRVETPAWDAQGFLWLKRDGSTEETDKDFLSLKLYGSLEDGIPMWLRVQVELTVAGKSREEELGALLPEGWRLASVDSQIPVAVDANGIGKAQVRAGKWIVRLNAFRFDNPHTLAFAKGAKVASPEQLLAFRSKPEFRVLEITGAPSIDVSQTTFPNEWRELPVYRWDTTGSIQLEERMRGMGQQKPAGLTVQRQLWLDENGSALTFRDMISGNMQQIWRLDAAAGQDLGSVRSAGQGQLITRNPQTGAPGVEIRTRTVSLEATGRMAHSAAFSASGWRSDADSVSVELQLPPGWRLLALFGADWVKGDWLTSWTLLDLFLLLVFSLGVYRLWGIPAAVLAFFAFGLSYHEAGAPRYAWLALLVPLALQRVMPEGRGYRMVTVMKWIFAGVLVLVLVPFIAQQVQQALYPQLEQVPGERFIRGMHAPAFQTSDGMVPQMVTPNDVQEEASPSRGGSSWGPSYVSKGVSKDNLKYESNARIQTGPGVPEWSWRSVRFGWNGPVQASQQVRPVLIPVGLERLLSAVRIALLAGLAALLLNARGMGSKLMGKGSAKTALILFAGFLALHATHGTAQAQYPDKTTLETLRARLQETSKAFPNAADIPSGSLKVDGRRISMELEVHAGARTAIPLPGKLPVWSPVSVVLDGKPEVSLRRNDGWLWVVVPEGVHNVQFEALLSGASEWELAFQLKPRRLRVEAPDWNFSGIRADGTPEAQLFFTRKDKSTGSQSSYERQELQAVALVERSVELGLIWQVRTRVSRLSPPGKALALRIPLLPGENVLSSNTVIRDGFIEVRLGAQQEEFTWESGLATNPTLKLATRAEDTWVERWSLVASPVWNVSLAGLPPVFESGNTDLVPVWAPWPGESVELGISRPEAVAGATVTVNSARHDVTLGNRQRASTLKLGLRCSLGEDFLVELPAQADVTSLTQNGNAIPVRKDGNKLIIPVRPGEQSIAIAWKLNQQLGVNTQVETVRLPVESANLRTSVRVPNNRWVLWAYGPQRGPAVRFWGILVCSVLAALALGRVKRSPLSSLEWMLLVIGLTQVPVVAAFFVVGWFFLLAWRGSDAFQKQNRHLFNLQQLMLIGATLVALGVLIAAVGAGLLGSPRMFITGNGSSAWSLQWFQARAGGLLPQPGCVSISIWWYRAAMLLWALWLAASLIRWLRLAWENFSKGALWRKKLAAEVPPLPQDVAKG